MTDSTFDILFVCTGNICRSPVAETMTRRLLDERLGASAMAFIVASAGTLATRGTGMAAATRAALTAYGAPEEARSFRARRLDPDMVAAADVVLTAERRHRQLVVMLQPAALPTTFCLLEFVRLLDGVDRHELPADPVEHAHAAVALARKRRGAAGHVDALADALPDPSTQTSSAHRRSVDLIATTSARLVELLTPLRTTAAARPRGAAR